MTFSNILYKAVGWQYPLLMTGTFLLAFMYGKDLDLLISLLLWYCLIYSIYVVANYRINKTLLKWISVLIGYILLTGISYTYNGVPFLAYYADFKAFLCPMLFVFIGAVNTDRKVYYWFLIAVGFCMVVGLCLYLFQPSWYLSYKANALSNVYYIDKNVTESNVMLLSLSSRFSSFFVNIYPVSYFGTFAFCIIINDIYKSKDVRLIKNRFLQLFLLLVILIGVIYTMVRVAFLFITLLTVFYLIYGFRLKNANNRIALSVIFLLIIVLMSSIIQFAESAGESDIMERIFDRLSAVSYDDLMSGSRNEQTDAVMNACENYLTGDGLGSRGGYARRLGLPGISDGGWIKFFVEFGIVGLMLFLSFVTITFKRALKALRYYVLEISIFAYGLIAMIGADTLSKGWMITIMWIAVGRIWNNNYLYDKKKLNDSI